MASVAEQIRAVNAEFVAAFKNQNAAGIAALYAERARLLPPGADAIEGRSKIRDFWQGAFGLGLTDAELETVEVEVVGGYTAIETGKFVLRAGGANADRGKYLVVWKSEDGNWRLHRDIWNSSVAAAQAQRA